MELKRAETIAENLVKALASGCERIEVAGSVRRGKPEVKDIELIAIPKDGAPRPMFGEKTIYKNRLEQILDDLRRSGMIEPVKGGDKYKQFWLLRDRVHLIKVDLFLVTPPAQWSVQMVIRTGPNSEGNNFSQWCVTQKHRGGGLPNGWRVQKGAVWQGEDDAPEKDLHPAAALAMPEEKDFLEFLGLGWIEPGERKANWNGR